MSKLDDINYTFDRSLVGRVMYGHDISDETGCTPGYTEFCGSAGFSVWDAPHDCLDRPVWVQLRRLASGGYRPVVVREASTGTWSAAGWTKGGRADDLAEHARALYDAVSGTVVYGAFTSSFTLQVMDLDLGSGRFSLPDPLNRTGRYWHRVAQVTDRLAYAGMPDVFRPLDPAMTLEWSEVGGMVESIVVPRVREHGMAPAYGDLFTWGLSAYRPYVVDPYDTLAAAVMAAGDDDGKSGKKVSATPCAGSAAVVQ